MLGNSESLPNSQVAWRFNTASFDKLLAEFDADRNSTGSAYEQLRLRLIHYFDWHGCAFPEELTAETFDRVARRLAEGEIIMDLQGHCFGIAQKLFLEVLARQAMPPALWMPKNQAQCLAERQFHAPLQPASEESQFREFQFACLGASLQQCSPTNRELVLSTIK